MPARAALAKAHMAHIVTGDPEFKVSKRISKTDLHGHEVRTTFEMARSSTFKTITLPIAALSGLRKLDRAEYTVFVSVAPDSRWKQRFQHFEQAHTLLRQALENGPSALSLLEKEGVIQRFEYSFELAWKTIKDFLEAGGIVITLITARQVIKDAFAAKIIGCGSFRTK